jgi:RNA polymerase sigma-70 factor (ECF subfamily)
MEAVNDHDDFASFYGAARDRIVAGLAVFCGDWDAAGDAASEAFTRACERWRRVSRMERPEGWVYQVGVNVLRRRRRREAIEQRAIARFASGGSTLPPQLDDVLWEAVRKLPDRQREAIALKYVVGLTQAEVATVMRIAPGTVGATLTHARAALAAQLTDQAEVSE